ncbi:hypothetical protein PANT111_490009 [Pantoea brenneri]|uniref:Uncharacterized protein n=1 Tax=Pantoea brenneri TaxID=472694 RepID=A0AAX3JBH7_9GAMM|nr:hypothetical protein PANT111_490009 [Pantoea brenneri]
MSASLAGARITIKPLSLLIISKKLKQQSESAPKVEIQPKQEAASDAKVKRACQKSGSITH